jgi:tetratricopeptide (TPR) repeat protein
MSLRPAIFISAVSRELRSARQLVANTLTFLGYEPEWQDIFGTEAGDLRAMLRRRIDGCKGVVQLLGECYGAEPPAADEQFGRVSYTQYEALYANSKGKKVWYLFLDETFPADPHEEEGEEKRKLQSDYRAKVKADSHLFHPLSNAEGLEASVLKLRDDLTRLRRGVRRWSAFVAVLLVLSVGLTVWLLESQQSSNKQLEAVQEKLEKLQQGVNSFAEVQNKVRQEQPGQKPDEIEQRTYGELGKELGLDPAMLKKQLPLFAQQLKNAPNATTYERANAAYVAKDYNESERLALAAADEALGASPPKNAEAIKAFELAGWADEKRIEYADALKRLRDAEKLTDRARDSLEWARVQFAIAFVLYDQGQYGDAERTFRVVLEERERVLGTEHPDTLDARNCLEIALYYGGKYAEAEAEARTLLAIRGKVLGPNHPDTLKARNNLADDLFSEGRYAEAETEFRDVVKLKEKVFGPENVTTLRSRNNLASVLGVEGKYAEAEMEFRALVMVAEKVFGPENRYTLSTRSNLAEALNKDGKYAEAEAESRNVLKLEEKVLGPEHPDTLDTRSNLAEALLHEGKYSEAEPEDRQVLKLEEKVLGPEHPSTLDTRNKLAEVLAAQTRFAEAEAEYRAVIILREKVLGVDHPDTLETCFDLANCLRSEGKTQEAKAFAQRAAEGARTALGSENPDTKKYEQLQQELLTKSE